MDPQFLNRYSYVRNNPIRYNDPDGHGGPIVVVWGVAIGVKELLLGGGGIIAAIQVSQNREQIKAAGDRLADSVSQMSKRGKEPNAIVNEHNRGVGWLPTGNAMGTGGWKPPSSRLEKIIFWGSVLATGTVLVEDVLMGQDPTSPTTLYPKYAVPNQGPAKPCDNRFMCCKGAAPQCTYSGDLSLQDISGDTSASDSSVTADGQDVQQDTPEVPTPPADTGDRNGQYLDYTNDY